MSGTEFDRVVVGVARSDGAPEEYEEEEKISSNSNERWSSAKELSARYKMNELTRRWCIRIRVTT